MLDYTKIQSETFNFLRFILAVFVVFIHVPHPEYPSGFSWYAYVFFSQGIARVAVPVFFLISGYLFCSGLEQQWDWSLWRSKIKKRTKSLLLPYVLWTLLFSLYLIAPCFYGSSQLGWDGVVDWYKGHNGIFGIFWSNKLIDYPLWFIRDLIVMVALSPLLYGFVKFYKQWGIVFLAVVYVLNLRIPIPGFSTEAFLFFSAGLYFRKFAHNIIAFSNRFSKWFYIFSILFLGFEVYFYGKNDSLALTIRHLFELFGVFSTFSLASHYVQRPKYTTNSFLASSSFFIFAAHVPLMQTRFLFNIPQGYLLKLNGLFPGSAFVVYLLYVVLVVSMCLAIYWLMRRFLPKTTSVLCGGR